MNQPLAQFIGVLQILGILLSPVLCTEGLHIKNIAEEEGWNESSVWEMQNIIIRYRDGSITQTDIEFDRSSSLLSEIDLVYSFDDYESSERMLFYEDWNGCIVAINPNEITFIELPYDQTDKALFEAQEDSKYF